MSVNKKKYTHGVVAIVLIISDRNTTTLIMFHPPTHPPFLKNAFHSYYCIFEPVMLHFVIIFIV